MRTQTLLVLSCFASLARAQTPAQPDDAAVWSARYARVEGELGAADRSGLTQQQRAGRDQVIAWLREYRLRADFGCASDRIDARVPAFVDDRGRRCAVAFMLDRSGHGDLVAEIAAGRNHGWLVELVGDPRVQTWLDAHGLSPAEAARIQGPMMREIPSGPPPSPPPPPPNWAGPADAMHRPNPGPHGNALAKGRAAFASVAASNSGTRTIDRRRGAVVDLELEWHAWWRANRDAYVQRDRVAAPARAPSARDTTPADAREELLPDLVRSADDGDAAVRAAATVALGRIGDDRHVPVLRGRLHDAQQGIRYWALLALGALGGPRATFELNAVASDRADGQPSIGPSARALALLGLALGHDRYQDGLVRAVAAGANARDPSVQMATLCYAGMGEPAAFAREAERLQTAPDLWLRGRALETLGAAATDAAVATLTGALSGPNRLLRRSAAFGLGRSKHQLALPALKTAYDLENEQLTRAVILLAIGTHREPEARDFLQEELRQSAKALRAWAALGLGLWLRSNDDERARAELRAAVRRERNDSAAPAYLLAMGLARDAGAVPLLAEAMREEREAMMRLAAGDALAMIADDAARTVLRGQIEVDPCATTRVALTELLVGVGTDVDVDAVIARIHRVSSEVERAQLIAALGARLAPASFALLRRLVHDPDTTPRVRAAAVHAVGRMLDAGEAYRFAELSRGSNWQLLPDWLEWLAGSSL